MYRWTHLSLRVPKRCVIVATPAYVQVDTRGTWRSESGIKTLQLPRMYRWTRLKGCRKTYYLPVATPAYVQVDTGRLLLKTILMRLVATPAYVQVDT